jgi:hypothetical protein
MIVHRKIFSLLESIKVAVWINFMPHLQSVLRNCFLLSIGTLGGGGGRMGEGDTHVSVQQLQSS